MSAPTTTPSPMPLSSIPTIIGGVAQHVQEGAAEFSPSARAQRKMFKEARDRMRTSQYGIEQAKLQQMNAVGQQQVAAQQAAQQADIARAQAGGQLAGGAATEAQRVVAQQAAGAVAANAGQNQAVSDAYAQQQRMNDQALIDAQADRARNFWRRQGQISRDVTRDVSAQMGGATATPDSGEDVFNSRKA